MARPLRIEYPGAWYHVLNRGRRREKIFFSDDDYILFLDILGKCFKLFNLEVHSYSLIPNHYHLLIHTPEGNLSRAMRHLNGVYTQAINRKYKTEGSLFRGRFRSILIDKDNYLLELLRYIHRNAYRAKLEKRIGEHKWTSHRAYMNKHKRPPWLKVNEVLLQFSEYEKEAKHELDAFVKKEVPREISQVLKRTRWPAILGGKRFKEDIKKILKGKRIKKRETPQYNELIKPPKAEDVIKAIESGFGQRYILSRKRERSYTSRRRAFAYVCRQYLYIPWRDICAMLGNISSAALSKQFRLATEEVEKKEGCYQDFRKIKKILKLNS